MLETTRVSPTTRGTGLRIPPAVAVIGGFVLPIGMRLLSYHVSKPEHAGRRNIGVA